MNILAQAATEAATTATKLAWYQNQTLLALAGIFGGIFVAFFVGKFLAKFFRTPELSGRIGLITWCLIVSAIIISIKPLKFGVDLRGGVIIIGKLNDQPGVEDPVKIQDIIPTLKDRIDPGGVKEIVIRPQGDNQMEVIIPDVGRDEAEQIWKLLTSAGQLSFRIVGDQNKHPALLKKARELVEAGNKRRAVLGEPDSDNPQGKQIGEWVTLARESPPEGVQNPNMPYKFVPSQTHLVRDRGMGRIINMDNVGLPDDRDQARVAFTKFCSDSGFKNVEILMATPQRDREDVKGEYLTKVQKGFDESAKPRIEFTLNAQGGKRLFSLTSNNRPANNRKNLLGIVLDGALQSAPSINEPIRSSGVIEGSFTDREIDGYTKILNSGKLKVALRENWISMGQVRSTLGEELKTKGLMAIGISLGLVLIFMLLYYRFCGMVACIALAMNLAFTLAILMLINVNLTLTGLAGLVLTIGMSVDANVLIFERIREELKRGAALRMAIRNGFDRATTTIVDANLTTLITAVILYVIGSDQIRSFSVTLIVGILMCMFTAIYVSRVFFIVAERRRWITKLNMASIVGNNPLDFLGKRRIAAMCSILLIGIGLAALFARGHDILDTDLAGGSTARIEFNQAKTVDQVRSALKSAPYKFEKGDIRYYVTQMESKNEFKIDSSLPVVENVEEYEGEVPVLKNIIATVFEGQLVMDDMTFDPSKIVVEDVNGTPIEISTPTSGGPRLSDHVLRAYDPVQEEQAGDEKSEASEQEGEEAASAGTATAPAETADPEVSAPQDDLTAPTENDPAPGAGEAQLSSNDLYKATATFTFAHPRERSTILDFLQEMAGNDISFDKSDCEITALGDDPLAARGTDWKVKMSLYDPNDAAKLLGRAKDELAGKPYFVSSSAVGGQIAGQTQSKAIFAMFASLIGIIAYVWIRFQNVAFGLAAIIALVHDVLVVLGAIALSAWLANIFGFLLIEDFRISLSVVAALLTIIGYSLNDTIVVFDRIREVRGKRTDITMDMINQSISQTLSRTILTSITTLLVVLILYFMGGESIHAFAFALVVGVVVGTYSSIFVASPALLWLMNRGIAPPVVPEQKGTAKA